MLRIATGLAPAVALVLAGLVIHTSATAQEIRGAGLSAGLVDSRQVWTPDRASGTRRGWLVGGFLDVALPVPTLGVLVEGLLVERGAEVPLEQGGRDLTTEVASDYLAMPILLKVRLFRAPVGVSVVAGPMVEMLVATRADASLAAVFDHERGSTWSVVAGVGAEGLVAGRWVLGAELRIVEGLTAAYDAPTASLRNRSVETAIRLGVRPATDRPPR